MPVLRRHNLDVLYLLNLPLLLHWDRVLVVFQTGVLVVLSVQLILGFLPLAIIHFYLIRMQFINLC